MRRRLLCLVLVLGCLPGVSAHSASCALRSPDRQIYEIFPKATRFKSITALLGQQARSAVEKRLGSALDLSDLGTHTIYLVLRGKQPIGFVHARSELGKNGTIELVWGLDLDLKMVAFRVQRSREASTDLIRSKTFQQKVLGGETHLRSMLGEANSRLDTKGIQVEERARGIAHRVVLCGLKTRLITEIVFRRMVFKARLIGNIFRFFPKTERITRVRTKTSTILLRARTAAGETIGLLAFKRWSGHETWWAVSPAGRLEQVVLVGMVKPELRKSAQNLREKTLAQLKDAQSGSLAHCWLELLTMLEAQKNR